MVVFCFRALGASGLQVRSRLAGLLERCVQIRVLPLGPRRRLSNPTRPSLHLADRAESLDLASESNKNTQSPEARNAQPLRESPELIEHRGPTELIGFSGVPEIRHGCCKQV